MWSGTVTRESIDLSEYLWNNYSMRALPSFATLIFLLISLGGNMDLWGGGGGGGDMPWSPPLR